MSFISQRMSRIKPSPTLAVSAKASELKALGQDIINLGAGEPDFDTPDHIKAAAKKAIENGATKYTAVEGTLPLRKAIAKKFKTENDLTFTPDEIMVSAGAKQVLFNAFMATLNPGDEVIIPAPYWVSYPDMVEIAEGTPVIQRCKLEHNLKLSPACLKESISPRTKWLILNSPNNPSGMAYTREELEGLADVLRYYPNIHVLSDDIYEHIVYDGFEFTTMAQVAPDFKSRTLMVNGVSKSYAMTGWRIGYGAGPKTLIDAMTTLQSQSTSNASSISQMAALTALQDPQDFIKDWVDIYQDRRDKSCEILSQVNGLSFLKPQGAFYLYLNCAELMGKNPPQRPQITSDTDLATYLLESAGVAVVPGAAFGLSPYFRISTATATDVLVDACKRIVQALSLLK